MSISGSAIDVTSVSTSRRVSRMLRPIIVAASARPARGPSWAGGAVEGIRTPGGGGGSGPEGAIGSIRTPGCGGRAGGEGGGGPPAGQGEEDVVEARPGGGDPLGPG